MDEARRKKIKKEKRKKLIFEIVVVIGTILLFAFLFKLFIYKMTMGRYPWIYGEF